MSTKKRKKRKHRAFLPYFTTPAIYVLISLLIVIPMCVILLNLSVKFVHKAQPSFAFSISDIELKDEAFKADGTNSGTVKRPSPAAGDKIAELSCEEAGFKCNVYYGANRVSLRSGAGMYTDILAGDTGVCRIAGERASAFSAVGNIKEGDKLRLVTNWGSFVYSVSKISTGAEPPEETMPQSLLLITESGDKAFSAFNEENTYILADIESGVQLEEEQK